MSNTNRNVTVTRYPAANPYPNRAYPANTPPAVAAPPPYYNSDHRYPQSNNQHDRDSDRITYLRFIINITVGIAILCISVIFITAGVVLHPEDPQFRVDSFSLLNFTLGSDLLDNFTSEIRLSVRNPNEKLKLVYGPVEASILYGSEFLSNTTVPRFSQETKNETFLTVNFADELIFLGRRVVVGINRDMVRNGTVCFNLVMTSSVSLEVRAWRYKHSYLRVLCGDLVVSIPTNRKSGTLTSGTQQCSVEFSVLP